MLNLIEKLLPVILIIFLGIFLREKKIIHLDAVEGLKQLITKAALPAVFFLSFSRLSLQMDYIMILPLVFLMCLVLYITGTWLQKLLPSALEENFSPGFFTGFELGMVGIGLFTALWGDASLPIIMLIGLGHEIFIWFIYVPLLEHKSSEGFKLWKTAKSFASSPIILAILLGILMNVTGIYEKFADVFWMSSIIHMLTMLSQLTTPLILIVIGYLMVFRSIQAKKVLQYVLLRGSCVGILGGGTLLLIHSYTAALDPMFNRAFIFFLMLPPPYILPLFIKNNKEEAELFSQMLVYYTLISFTGYILLMVF